MVAVSRDEPGTVVYDWYLDEPAGTGTLYEAYASREALQAHGSGAVFTELAPQYLDALRVISVDVFGEAADLPRRDVLGAPTTWWGADRRGHQRRRLVVDRLDAGASGFHDDDARDVAGVGSAVDDHLPARTGGVRVDPTSARRMPTARPIHLSVHRRRATPRTARAPAPPTAHPDPKRQPRFPVRRAAARVRADRARARETAAAANPATQSGTCRPPTAVVVRALHPTAPTAPARPVSGRPAPPRSPPPRTRPCPGRARARSARSSAA